MSKTLNPQNFSLLPISKSSEQIPSDGLTQKVSGFCKKTFNAKCIEHYSKLTEGFTQCPFGFSSYKFPVKKRSMVWTGIKVKGYCNLAVVRARESTKGFKVFETEELLNLVNRNLDLTTELDRIFDDKIKHEQDSLQILQKHTFNAFHEIRPLNAEIKAAVHRLRTSLGRYKPQMADAYDFVQSQLEVIAASSDMVSIRMEQRDLLANPKSKIQDEAQRINLDKEFQTIYQMFRTSLKRERLKMKIVTTKEIKTNSIFKLIPFVIIENAFKYSPANIDQEILVEEKVTDLGLAIWISSLGPEILENEKSEIFDAFVRGVKARDEEGSGVGLFVAKQVARLLDISVSVEQSKKSFSFNDIDYFETKFVISIPKSLVR